MENEEVFLCDGADKLHVFPGILGSHPLEIVDKRFFTICDVCIVLDLLGAQILTGASETPPNRWSFCAR
jgi:hypothetical protein